MPRNKRESLIYTVLMCFTMVLWMSIYNVTLHMGALNLTTIREALDRIPDRLCVRDVPGLVCGLRTGEGLRVPFSCKAGELGTPQGDRGFLLHGGSDGHHHVPVRRA